MTSFIKCMQDGFIQVRDEEGLLLGVCKMDVPATASIVTTASGQVFQLGIIGMPGVLCRKDQDPNMLQNFEPYEVATIEEEELPE